MIIGFPPFYSDSPNETCNKILNWVEYFSFPTEAREISEEAKMLIIELIQAPNKRLGFNGSKEIKSHPFFKSINFEKIKKYKPFFIPKLKSEYDTKYFDKLDQSNPLPPGRKLKGIKISRFDFIEKEYEKLILKQDLINENKIYNQEEIAEEFGGRLNTCPDISPSLLQNEISKKDEKKNSFNNKSPTISNQNNSKIKLNTNKEINQKTSSLIKNNTNPRDDNENINNYYHDNSVIKIYNNQNQIKNFNSKTTTNKSKINIIKTEQSISSESKLKIKTNLSINTNNSLDKITHSIKKSFPISINKYNITNGHFNSKSNIPFTKTGIFSIHNKKPQDQKHQHQQSHGNILIGNTFKSNGILVTEENITSSVKIPIYNSKYHNLIRKQSTKSNLTSSINNINDSHKNTISNNKEQNIISKLGENIILKDNQSILEKLKKNLKLNDKIIMDNKTNPNSLQYKNNFLKEIKSTTNKSIKPYDYLFKQNISDNKVKNKIQLKDKDSIKMIQNNHFMINLNLNLFPNGNKNIISQSKKSESLKK